jgi:hydroxypyruvate isomerase
MLFPSEVAPARRAALAADGGVTLGLCNLPPGAWAGGVRGRAARPGRVAEFAASVAGARDYSRRSGMRQAQVMAGAGPEATAATYRRNLAEAAARFAEDGVTLLIEPINPRDVPGYFLTRCAQALETIAAVGAPNLRLQLDVYHRQIVEGDLIRFIEAQIGLIGHVQIAGVPDRGEPDRGEVRHEAVFEALDGLGYAGWVGCEYRPRAGTEAGLGWMAPWRVSGRGPGR